jgi:hypothetical protein
VDSGYVTLGPMQREVGSTTKDDFEKGADETHRGPSKRSSNATGVLRNQFPALCDELLAWQQLHRRRQFFEPKTRLGSVLPELPALSLVGLYERFDLPSDSLERMFPTECASIRARYASARRETPEH